MPTKFIISLVAGAVSSIFMIVSVFAGVANGSTTVGAAILTSLILLVVITAFVVGLIYGLPTIQKAALGTGGKWGLKGLSQSMRGVFSSLGEGGGFGWIWAIIVGSFMLTAAIMMLAFAFVTCAFNGWKLAIADIQEHRGRSGGTRERGLRPLDPEDDWESDSRSSSSQSDDGWDSGRKKLPPRGEKKKLPVSKSDDDFDW